MMSSGGLFLRNVSLILTVIASLVIGAPAVDASSYRDFGSDHRWAQTDWEDRGMLLRVAYRAEGSAFQHFMEPMKWFWGQIPPRVIELRRLESHASLFDEYPDDDHGPVAGIPEMGAAALFGLGLVVVYFSTRRRLTQVS